MELCVVRRTEGGATGELQWASLLSHDGKTPTPNCLKCKSPKSVTGKVSQSNSCHGEALGREITEDTVQGKVRLYRDGTARP